MAAEWQDWGQWSECSATCGPGTWLRARACGEPRFGGDEQCPGKSTEAGECEISECPGFILLIVFAVCTDIKGESEGEVNRIDTGYSKLQKYKLFKEYFFIKLQY